MSKVGNMPPVTEGEIVSLRSLNIQKVVEVGHDVHKFIVTDCTN